jgi:glycosyltransferase family protein
MIRVLKSLYRILRYDNPVMREVSYRLWVKRTAKERRLFRSHDLKIEPLDRTVKALRDQKISLSRFGDGEFRLMLNQGTIVFQEGNQELATRLREVFQSKLPNHRVGVPKSFQSVAGFKRHVQYFWLQYLNLYGNAIAPYFDFNQVYADSFLSRFYIDYASKSQAPKTVALLKSLWKDQEVLVVEGALSRLGVANDLWYNVRSLERILCPPENAFASYDAILTKTKASGKNKLIILALGPSATVMAYDLAQEGYWAIDLGHFDVEYMWMLIGATTKVPIPGRYVSEARTEKNYALPAHDIAAYTQSIVFDFNDAT